MYPFNRFSLLAISAFLLSASTLPAQDNSAKLKAKIMTALERAYVTSAFKITVPAPGHVVINGGVPSYWDKLNVFAIVARVPGVKGISNRLIVQTAVVPDPDRQAGIFHHYNPNPVNQAQFGDNNIIRFFEDRKGNLWIGTTERQYFFDRSTGQCRFVKGRAGTGLGRRLLEDQHGTIWGWWLGLYKVEVNNLTFIHYRLLEPTDGPPPFGGLQGFYRTYNEIESTYLDAQGSIWCGTRYGLYQFDPLQEQVTARYYHKDGLPSNFIAKITADNAGRLWLLTGVGVSIFDETAPPGAQFTNLGSDDGVINSPSAPEAFIRTRNGEIYWGGTNGIYRFYPEVKSTNPLLEIERTRLRIARDLHDDVGSSLSSIALTAELLQKESATDSLANRQLARVHDTAQKLSRNLKEIVWAIDPQRDKFDDLLLHMKESAEELLGQKGITYTVDFPPDKLPQSLKMEFRRNLFLIYKEMLHNVLQHAEATQVGIVLARTNGMLQLQVADNGKGFGEEKVGNGSGLKSMRARAGELNGQLEIDSGPERGTRVTFTVNCR